MVPAGTLAGTMRRPAVRALATIPMAAAALVISASARPASAEVSGPCTATLAGRYIGQVSSPGSGARVPGTRPVAVTVQSRAAITSFSLGLEVAGLDLTLSTFPGRGDSWKQFVSVDRFNSLGVGVYKVVGRSRGPGACTVKGFIRIQGAALGTLAGKAGLGALALGLIGLAVAAVIRSREKEALRNLAWAKEEGGRWQPRWSPFGILGGLSGAAGALILLQQDAVVYPSLLVVLASALLGFLVGVAVPTGTRLLYVRRLG